MRERIVSWIAWHLPRVVIYHAAVRMFAHATTGRWSHVEAPGVLLVDALERWKVEA